MKDLLDILGDVPMEGYCSQEYWKWEQEVAEPQLRDLGYEVVRWAMGEVDSFGPLSRVVTVTRDGELKQFVYG
jgi:hypothetical protein